MRARALHIIINRLTHTKSPTTQMKQEGVAPNWITYGIVYRLLMGQNRVAEAQALLTQVRICIYPYFFLPGDTNRAG